MSSNPAVAAIVFIVLLAASVPVARRLANEEGDRRLFNLVMVGLLLRFACTFLQVYVVKHYYGGLADFVGYENTGAQIATGLHSGHFSPGYWGVSGTGTVNVAVGFVFAIVGANQIAGFAIFAWLAFLGTVSFYRAFRIALPGADRMRYAVLLFLMPSLVFWTAAIGKEALMTAFLGVAANGGARLFRHQRGAVARLVLGLGLATLLRPDESILLFGALCVGFLVSRARSQGRAGPLGLIAWLVLLGAAGFGLLEVTVHFLHLHSLSLTAITHELQRQHLTNSGTGAGNGSSNYRYSPSFTHYFDDAYVVLFDPLPFQAHSTTQLLASMENLIVLGVVVASLGRLWTAVRSCLREPYVLMSLIYALAFLYLFAALGNLGLIDRERVLLFPVLFVLFCLPAGRPSASPAPEPPAALRPPAPARLVPMTSRWAGRAPARTGGR